MGRTVYLPIHLDKLISMVSFDNPEKNGPTYYAYPWKFVHPEISGVT